MKKCVRCGELKGLNDFYPHRLKCKTCYCEQVNATYQREKVRYRKTRREYMTEFRKNPLEMLKVKARNAVNVEVHYA